MSGAPTPTVLWAQRSSSHDDALNYVFLTVAAPDVPREKLQLTVQPTMLTLHAHSDLKNLDYHVELELYAEILPEKTRINHTDQNIELVLYKAEPAEAYWPRLLKGSQRIHFLKTDFDQWVDEDDQHDAEEDYMSRMRPHAAALETDQTQPPAIAADDATAGIPLSGPANRPLHESDSDTLSNSDDVASDDNSDGPLEGEPSPTGATRATQSIAGSLESSNEDGDSDGEGVDDYLDGVRRLIVTTSRKPLGSLRPLDFKTWKKRADRNIELRNSEQSRLMRLPKELRLTIWEMVLLSVEPVHFCSHLMVGPSSLYNSLVNGGVWERNHGRNEQWKMKAMVKKYERSTAKSLFHPEKPFHPEDSPFWIGIDNDFSDYESEGYTTEDIEGGGSDSPGKTNDWGLLFASKALHRESTQVMYRGNTFAFHDMHGFVAMECFFRTIGHTNIQHLRKLEVHVPIWRHGRNLDRLRSTWIYKSVPAFKLTPSTPHKDRIRGSFEGCFVALLNAAKLQELTLIISPPASRYWAEDANETSRNMPNNKKLIYAKRISLEHFVFSRLRTAMPSLRVTVVAQEDPTLAHRARMGRDKEYEAIYSAIQRKCNRFGFTPVRQVLPHGWDFSWDYYRQ